MATETTYAGSLLGRLPGVSAASKVPGPALKVKYGKFTVGTSEYPAGGYAAADLETITGLTHIEAVVPCGLWLNGNTQGFGASWDGAARKLMAFGNLGLDGNSLTTGTVQMADEMAANDSTLDAAVLYALVIGY
jgi:hypothetical protein